MHKKNLRASGAYETRTSMSSFLISFLYLMVLAIVLCNVKVQSAGLSNKLFLSDNGDYNQSKTEDTKSEKTYSSHRKLLLHETCTNRDISISQSRDLSSGIPQYIVQIVNTCLCGCSPSNIHLHCGWFASARIVNPRTFKRLSYDDCLVNGGKPLKTSQTIRFSYSNSFMYPLSFKYAKFC